MTTKGPAGRTVDRDGVVRIDLRQGRPSHWIWLLGLAAAGALVALAIGAWSRLGPAPPAGRPRANGNDPAHEAAAVARPGSPARKAAAPGVGDGPDEEPAPAWDPEPAGEPGAADLPFEVAPAGAERTGIGAFPAPGTKRIQRGIVVPDDFELPPGYVRHFQTTDKGRMLRAILMFHPDYEPVDAEGHPVPIPADRVVPPEMAPPGLPLELLEAPTEDDYAHPDEDGLGDGDGAGAEEDGADSDP